MRCHQIMLSWTLNFFEISLQTTYWCVALGNILWSNEWQGRSHFKGWEWPQTSARRVILGFFGLYGPCFLACSTNVSSLKMASNWSQAIAQTNIPNKIDSKTKITECKIRDCFMWIISRLVGTPESTNWFELNMHSM